MEDQIKNLEDKVAKLEQVLNTLNLRVEMLLTNSPDVRHRLVQFEYERSQMETERMLREFVFDNNPELRNQYYKEQLERLNNDTL